VSLIGEAAVQLAKRKATGSVFDPQSQTFKIVHGTPEALREYGVRGWLHLDPWLLYSAALLAPLAVARRATRAVAFAFVIQAAVVLRPGYLPYMYVIGLLPFAALIVAGSAEVLWRTARNGLPSSNVDRGMWRRSLASVTRTAAAAGLIILVSVCATVVAPSWVRADRQAMTARLDGPERAAEQWLVTNVDHSKRLLVSNDFWIYLIEHGFDSQPVSGGFYSRTVVFYWSFDFDPAVQRVVPQGWRDFDFIVSTQGMRNDIRDAQVPLTAQAVAHSRVVIGFGNGAQRVEVRAVER
jgi:hypothetical protein